MLHAVVSYLIKHFLLSIPYIKNTNWFLKPFNTLATRVLLCLKPLARVAWAGAASSYLVKIQQAWHSFLPKYRLIESGSLAACANFPAAELRRALYMVRYKCCYANSICNKVVHAQLKTHKLHGWTASCLINFSAFFKGI